VDPGSATGIRPEPLVRQRQRLPCFDADAPLSQRELRVWRIPEWGIDRARFFGGAPK
jgi:hypothetical protein